MTEPAEGATPRTNVKWRARVDARGWWRIGPVRIEPKAGENPANRKTLAMRIERLPELERELAVLQAELDTRPTHEEHQQALRELTKARKAHAEALIEWVNSAHRRGCLRRF